MKNHILLSIRVIGVFLTAAFLSACSGLSSSAGSGATTLDSSGGGLNNNPPVVNPPVVNPPVVNPPASTANFSITSGIGGITAKSLPAAVPVSATIPYAFVINSGPDAWSHGEMNCLANPLASGTANCNNYLTNHCAGGKDEFTGLPFNDCAQAACMEVAHVFNGMNGINPNGDNISGDAISASCVLGSNTNVYQIKLQFRISYKTEMFRSDSLNSDVCLNRMGSLASGYGLPQSCVYLSWSDNSKPAQFFYGLSFSAPN